FPDGTPVKFPTPRMRTERYDVDTAHPGLVRDITGLIAALHMARYRPSAYDLAAAHEEMSAATLAGLLQSGILKRFESCWWACLNTVSRMISAHDAFLSAWDQGVVLSRAALREAAGEELDDAGVATWVAEAMEEDLEQRPVTAFRPD